MFDDGTDLQWNINRWYDAQVGRWLSEDPIQFRGKDSNLFRYCANSPVLYVDLNGLVTNKYQFYGGEMGNRIVKWYDGKKRVFPLNELGNGGTHDPLQWMVAACFNGAWQIEVSAEKNTTIGCWSPRFTVKGFVIMTGRPVDTTIVRRKMVFWTYTNLDIWVAWWIDYSSEPFASTFDGFLDGIGNHEWNHYNTFIEAVDIIVAGLEKSEKYRFMTKQKALDYGEKAQKEGNDVFKAARKHSTMFNTDQSMKANSFLDPNCEPFTEPFNVPLPYME